MTIKVKHTVEKEVEISLPAFRKSTYEVAKIIPGSKANTCAVERVWILDSNFCHSKREEYYIDDLFTDEKYSPATEDDFEQQMSAMAALLSDDHESKAA